MRLPCTRPPRGFALVIVLIVITVLGVLAGTFAYSMKVETRLARNASHDSTLEWLGRSGVEQARYFVALSMSEPYTSLNQRWAGGPGSPRESNSPLAELSLTDNQLGEGSFSIKIRDAERKFNINAADEEVLNRALALIGIDATDAPTVSQSILDWRDPDDRSLLSGTESEFYLTMNPPYRAKDGPIDDLAELLLVRGVDPALYWGPNVAAHRSQLYEWDHAAALRAEESPRYPVGLVDLFTPVSNRQINVNTASAQVLQLLPGVDQIVAESIIRARAGPDGVEGTEDDTPFQNVGMLNPAVVPGLNPQMAALYSRFASVASTTFEVTVLARVGDHSRKYHAVVRRNSPRDVPVLEFSWR